MREVTSITSKATQNFFLYSEEGEEISVTLRFLPTQASWFMDITCGDFTVYNMRVCQSENILDKWHNILNFGIQVVTYNGQDPFQIDDFYEKRALFLLLNRDDLKFTTGVLDGEEE